jgi:alcohol dehydrogenase
VESEDRRTIAELAGGPIDCVLDMLPREATTSQVLAAMLTVRPGGRVVLMGGVGRQGGTELTLPYPWLMRNDITVRGKWMYSRDVVGRMIRLVRAGLVDLSKYDVTEFALDDANEAVDHAASHSGPLRLTVIRPD